MRYTVTLGRTKRPAEYESIRVEYTQEFNEEETPREAGWMEVKAFVLQKMAEELAEYAEKEAKDRGAEEPSTAKPASAISGSEKALAYAFPGVERLPWRAFKEKRDAKPDEPGWIFTNTRGAEKLVQALQKDGAVFVTMGSHRFLCKLSGDKEMFVNRTLPKEEPR